MIIYIYIYLHMYTYITYLYIYIYIYIHSILTSAIDNHIPTATSYNAVPRWCATATSAQDTSGLSKVVEVAPGASRGSVV